MKETIGILGDGQLAKMLTEAAKKLSVSVVVLSEHSNSPAKLAGAQCIQGNWKNKTALHQFFQMSPIVLFENEFIEVPLLREASRSSTVRFFPSLDAIEKLQQKLSQKKILQEFGIPTSQWVEWDQSSIEAWIPHVAQTLGIPFVLKWSYLGYDGKGVRFIRKTEDLNGLEAFFQKAKENGSSVYAEAFVPFRKELAMVTTHSKKNGFAHYPLVVSEQDHGICSHVYGPATEFKVSPALELAAQEYSKRLADGIELEGTFAIEFFETEDGELVVNEIAPRVHNTGHYTQDACDVSQFENHLRAALDLPLGKTTPKGIFSMLNLLGPEGVSKEVNNTNFLPKTENRPYAFSCHWYGKSKIEPRRKLGHLNGVVQAVQDFPKLEKEMNKWHQEWVQNVKKL